MRLILIIIFWVIGLLLFWDITDGLKWVIIWWFIWFIGTYFQARTSNYFNIQEQWDSVLSMFWRYQDLEDNYEMALDDMNFKAELWKSSSNVMTEWMDREEYKSYS